jgi:hypothetical protein
MANRLYKQFQGTLESGVVMLYGSAVTSTSGTIASKTGKGLTITKTAAETGRYTVTLADKYTALLNCRVVLVGAADAAYTGSKGLVSFLRNVDVSGVGSFDIQFSTALATPADAELESAASFLIEVTLKNSSAY